HPRAQRGLRSRPADPGRSRAPPGCAPRRRPGHGPARIRQRLLVGRRVGGCVMDLEPRTATIPTPDRDSPPYWAALADGRFPLQHCREGGRWSWPVRPLCSGCHGDDLAWDEPAGTGEVYSWVVTHQRYSRDLPVPHTIALVRLDEQDDILIPGIYV